MGSTLSIWLAEAGFSKQVIGVFALFGLPFTMKILWTPLIDHYSWPFCSNSRRKSWVLFALLTMASIIFAMSFIDPEKAPWQLAMCISLLSLFTGCLYIAGIAYELESLENRVYSLGSAFVNTGYRLGLLCAGGGALYFSSLWGWAWMFRMLAALLFCGGLLISYLPEPYRSAQILEEKKHLFAKYSSSWNGFWNEVIVEPCRLFFQKSHWPALLALILMFKMGDHLVKSMEGPFYLSLGFVKSELATASKIWGMAATVCGAFLAGFFLRGKNPFICLGVVSCLHACSLSCYYLMCFVGKSLPALYATTAAEHLTAGMAITSFICFLWSLCDKRYAAVQYALMWSLFSFKADMVACCGGFLAAHVSWPSFFLIVTAFGISTALGICLIVSRMNRATESLVQ